MWHCRESAMLSEGTLLIFRAKIAYCSVCVYGKSGPGNSTWINATCNVLN